MDGTIAGAITRSGNPYDTPPAPPAIGTTSPRALGWAIAAGIACVPLLLLMLAPWLLTGRAVVEFETRRPTVLLRRPKPRQSGPSSLSRLPARVSDRLAPPVFLPFLAGRDIPTYRKPPTPPRCPPGQRPAGAGAGRPCRAT